MDDSSEPAKINIQPEVAADSVTGRVRKENADAFRIYRDQPFVQAVERCWILALADGMGSFRGAGEAARLAVDQVAQFYHVQERFFSGEQTLRNLIYKANDSITEMQRSTPGHYGMACTFTCAMIERGLENVVIFHAGDSSCYLLRGKTLVLLTTRHQNASGALTMHLGVGTSLKLERIRVRLMPGDLLMLCSDGLDGYVPNLNIQEILAGPGTPSDLVSRLMDQADQTGGKDNTTVIVARIPQLESLDEG